MVLQVRLERLLERAAVMGIFVDSRAVSHLHYSSFVSVNANRFSWLCDGELFFKLSASRLEPGAFFHFAGFRRR